MLQTTACRDKAKELWYAIGTLNFIGALAVIVGARTDHIVYLVGVVCLLPGSIISSLAVNTWDHRDFSIHWNCCGTNSAGMIDLLYLPFALFINMLLASIIVRLAGKWIHRDKNAASVAGLRQH